MPPSSPIKSSMVACHECDLVHRVQPLGAGETAKCTRCGAVLFRHKRNSLDRVLALSLTGLILFLLSNAFPFMVFELEGRGQQNTLISGTLEFWRSGYWELAVLVFLVSILFPLMHICLMLYVHAPLKLGRIPWKVPAAFRFLNALKPWAMMEVYMLGVLVAIVKLSDLASIEPGVAFYSFAALIIVSAAANAHLDPRVVWERLAVEGER